MRSIQACNRSNDSFYNLNKVDFFSTFGTDQFQMTVPRAFGRLKFSLPLEAPQVERCLPAVSPLPCATCWGLPSQVSRIPPRRSGEPQGQTYDPAHDGSPASRGIPLRDCANTLNRPESLEPPKHSFSPELWSKKSNDKVFHRGV